MQIVLLKEFRKDKSLRRNVVVEFLWEICNLLFFQNRLCSSSLLKGYVLRLFGAKIGMGIVLKQNVRIKYPWKLSMGDHCWIGESVWIDNIVAIDIGANVALSQGAFLTTGNHDWTKQDFPLTAKSIVIDDGVWVGAKAMIGPGVRLQSHSIVTMGSVVTKNTEPYGIYSGNPAVFCKKRIIQ